MSRNGSCLCGTVSYELDARPERAGACHCGMCRKFSGGVYLTFVNGGVKLGHGAAQNWATLDLSETREMGGGQSAALSM